MQNERKNLILPLSAYVRGVEEIYLLEEKMLLSQGST